MTFPLPVQDDFESYAQGQTPRYFSDQAGTFETSMRADGSGRCLRQVLPQKGLRWTAEWQPYTLLGDSGWKDYEVSASVLSETNTGLVFVMGRVGSVPGFSDAVPRGYWLALNCASNQWELYAASNLLASGWVNAQAGTWHQLRLAMTGSRIGCYVDGARVTSLSDAAYGGGLAGLGCGWHGAQFDNFALRPLHPGSLNLAPSARASASSVWSSAYTADQANDANPSTRWNCSPYVSSNEWLELDFPTPVTFNRTACAQFGSAIQGYQVQHWNGSGWIVDLNGGVLGPSSSDSFPAVTSTKVRLFLTSLTGWPSLYEFGVYADRPATNLAPAATASASSTWSSGYTAALANDGNSASRWSAGVNQTNSQWLQLDWPAPVSFNRTVFFQFASRINAYKIQHWNGSGWVDDESRGPAALCQSDCFPTVTSSRLRLLMTTNANVPTLWELQVFNDPEPSVPVRINEWMVNNAGTLSDPAGGFQSWFELYNAGTARVDLAGYYLGRSWKNLFEFPIPPGFSLGPGGYLLVWADGQTNFHSGGSDLHASFTLAQAPGISVCDPSGKLVDAVELGSQAPDTASGSRGDGDPAILTLSGATPRQSNNRLWAFLPAKRAPDGALLLSFQGLPFAAHRVLASASLQSPAWTGVARADADAFGHFAFAETNVAAFQQRFYRAATP